jgi:uncharacterized protein YbaP (TraB family)
MKYLISLLISIILFQITLKSQDNNSLLWEISGNGLEKKSYLFGTMHVLPKKDFFINKTIKNTIMKSDVVFFEVNMFGMSLSEKLALVSDVFLKNTTLENIMSKEEYNNIKQFAKDTLGIKEKKFIKKYNKLTPFALNSIFTVKYLGKIKMYEKEIYKIAKKKKLKIKELETADFQMSLIKDLSYEKQIEYFLDINSFSEIRTLISLYKEQNIYGIYESSIYEIESNEEYKDFFENFLIKRNKKWIPIISNNINNNSCFIAVGAAHLPGEFGVIELLKKEGYNVNPIF